MRKINWTISACALLIGYFLLSLLLPIAQGESPIELGLDLAGGVIVTYRPDFAGRLNLGPGDERGEQELLALAKETITSRISRNLNTIPEVMVRSDQRIVVSIPGSQDYRRVLDVVGKTYHLTLRLVLGRYQQQQPGLYPYNGHYLELAQPRLDGDMLDQRSIRVEAMASNLDDPGPKIAFRFKPPHDQAFAEFTGTNVGRQLAILLDDRVEWAGMIESRISGDGFLSGNYTMPEAREIATMLSSGSLPVGLEIESVSAVGPGLGQEIRQLGWQALALSFGGLVLLLVLAYLHRTRLLLVGLLSLVALLVSLAGLAATFNLTLDLAGVAGLILSVGIGMDAFILVFERLEARQATPGQCSQFIRSLYSASGEGPTLLHANATTLVVIMLLLGSERLSSFAYFILAGIAASVLTIFFTRSLLLKAPKRLDAHGPDLLKPLRTNHFGLFRLRKLYLAALAIAIVVTGTLMITGSGTPGAPALELGADFKPGTQLVLTAADESQVEAALEELRAQLPETAIRHQRLGPAADTRYLVTIGGELAGGEVADDSGLLHPDMLADALAQESLSIESLNAVDERLSGSRLLRSCSVLLLSLGCLALYFLIQDPIERLVFARSLDSGGPRARLLIFAGVALAVLADLAVVLMVLAHLRIAIDLPVVAAMLTIIGYSVNDSVVLFNHVRRQPMAAEQSSQASALAVVTTGVDRVLSRACLTSLSTMLPALSILILGLEPLRGFAWVMIAGTTAGTMSSLFIVGLCVQAAMKAKTFSVPSYRLSTERGIDSPERYQPGEAGSF